MVMSPSNVTLFPQEGGPPGEACQSDVVIRGEVRYLLTKDMIRKYEFIEY